MLSVPFLQGLRDAQSVTELSTLWVHSPSFGNFQAATGPHIIHPFFRWRNHRSVFTVAAHLIFTSSSLHLLPAHLSFHPCAAHSSQWGSYSNDSVTPAWTSRASSNYAWTSRTSARCLRGFQPAWHLRGLWYQCDCPTAVHQQTESQQGEKHYLMTFSQNSNQSQP